METNQAFCKTCGTSGPPWNHTPTPLAPHHGLVKSESIDKELAISIKQIVSDARLSIVGLGSDNMIYVWSPTGGIWKLWKS